MIRIHKGANPAVLAASAAQWTQDLLDVRAAGGNHNNLRGRYRHIDVKHAIEIETHSKCVYCEHVPLVGNFVIVEHLLPWEHFPLLAFHWRNLTLVCRNCNSGKLDKFPFVNPINQEPSRHVSFVGPILIPRSELGLWTEEEVKLNRPHLFEDRRKNLKEFNDWIRFLTPTQRFDIIDEHSQNTLLQKYMDPKRNYSAMFRERIAVLRQPINAISHEQIALRAYSIWETEGKIPGSEERNWIRARRELAIQALSD